MPLLVFTQPLLDRTRDMGSLDTFISCTICLDEFVSKRIFVLLSYAYSSLRVSRSLLIILLSFDLDLRIELISLFRFLRFSYSSFILSSSSLAIFLNRMLMIDSYCFSENFPIFMILGFGLSSFLKISIILSKCL